MSPLIAATALKTAVAVTQSQNIGTPLVRKTYGLHWEILTTIYGGEDQIRTVTKHLRESQLLSGDSELQQALGLTDRYLSGWRPKDRFAFPDDESSDATPEEARAHGTADDDPNR
jgi:hypothetical protein